MTQLKVRVTGASGKIAGQLLPAFRERYDLRLLDIKTTNLSGEEVAGIITTDLLESNRDSYREHFKGMDAVVHIGFVSNADANPNVKFAQAYATNGL